MLPRIVARLAELQVQHRTPLRTLRLVQQLQPGLRRRAVALAAVAGHARADNVFPRRFAAAIARNNVVEIEVLAVELDPAILAGVVVALEDIVPRELHFLFRHPIKEKQQDHLRHANRERNRAHHVSTFVATRKAEPLVERHRLERAAVGLDHLRMALIKKHERPLHAADVHRLPQTVQHEDVVAEDRFHGSLSIARGGKPPANGTCGCHVGTFC